jgi:hypothetical protein
MYYKMKEQTVKGLQMVVPEGSAFRHETPEHLPKLHQNTIFCGKRGSGKGVAMYNMIKRFRDCGKMDRLFVISPTFNSNKKLLEEFNIDSGDIYDDLDNDKCVLDIVSKIEAEARELETYRALMKQYQRFKRLMDRGDHISDDLLEAFYDGNGFPPPQHKWGGKEPVMGLIVDDAQGSNLFKSRKFQNFIIRHRHVGAFESGGALGCSVFICIQSYMAQNGCPRSVRNNITSMCLFKTKDEKELDQVSREMSGEVSPEQFVNVYNQAIREPHDFLFIDLHKKPTQPSMFRRNFDTYLVSN